MLCSKLNLSFPPQAVTPVCPPSLTVLFAGKLTVSGNQILEDGRPIVMHGINYFGFNNAQTMVDGLWAGG